MQHKHTKTFPPSTFICRFSFGASLHYMSSDALNLLLWKRFFTISCIFQVFSLFYRSDSKPSNSLNRFRLCCWLVSVFPKCCLKKHDAVVKTRTTCTCQLAVVLLMSMSKFRFEHSFHYKCLPSAVILIQSHWNSLSCLRGSVVADWTIFQML